jgi:hypothetical protein
MQGEIVFRKGTFAGAAVHYRDALAQYTKAGSTLGEANCIYSLGDVEFHTGRFSSAQERYLNAKPLYEHAASKLGEKNCDTRLKELGYPRSVIVP